MWKSHPKLCVIAVIDLHHITNWDYNQIKPNPDFWQGRCFPHDWISHVTVGIIKDDEGRKEDNNDRWYKSSGLRI